MKLKIDKEDKGIKYTIINILYSLSLFVLIYRVISQFLVDYTYESWQISEFLINYQSGFLRRGLIGEALFIIAKYFHLDVQFLIKIFCLLCFLFVCYFFTKSFLKKGYMLYVLPLCFFIGMGAFNGFWIRKDYLMICFLIGSLYTFKSSLSMLSKFFIINLLIISIQLVHESFMFFSLPILFVLLWNDFKYKGHFKAIISAILYLLPSAITFLLTLYYHGNIDSAQQIWNSWASIGVVKPSMLDEQSHSALSAISWTSQSTFLAHFKINFMTKDMNVLSIAFWLLVAPTVYYITTNAIMAFRKNESIFSFEDRTILSFILIFQFINLIPFFTILSCDMVRVYFYWITSSFTIFLIIPKTQIAQVIPKNINNFIEKLNNNLTYLIRPTKTTLALLMLFVGIPSVGFSFNAAIESSIIYNFLRSISYVFSFFINILSTIF